MNNLRGLIRNILKESERENPKNELLRLQYSLGNLFKVKELKKTPLIGFNGVVEINGDDYDLQVNDYMGEYEYVIQGFSSPQSIEDNVYGVALKGNIHEIEEDLKEFFSL